MQTRYDAALQDVLALRRRVADVHPTLGKAFPIALVADNQFHVFDVDASGERYEFATRAPTSMTIPEGVRAAFPLACYGERVGCVVTGDVFDTLDGYATILHEFVHCHQGETCERRLKETLSIARKAEAEGDHMWEIAYPFPYQDTRVAETYLASMAALADGAPKEVQAARAQLTAILDPADLEYLAWQEWKEGLARYVENGVKRRLGITENHGGSAPPLSRVSFYEGGSRYIAFLYKQDPSLPLDLEALFYQIQGSN